MFDSGAGPDSYNKTTRNGKGKFKPLKEEIADY